MIFQWNYLTSKNWKTEKNYTAKILLQIMKLQRIIMQNELFIAINLYHMSAWYFVLITILISFALILMRFVEAASWL